MINDISIILFQPRIQYQNIGITRGEMIATRFEGFAFKSLATRNNLGEMAIPFSYSFPLNFPTQKITIFFLQVCII